MENSSNEDSSILCPSCGSSLNVGVTFCPSCGRQVVIKDNQFIKTTVFSVPFVAGEGIIGGLIGFFIVWQEVASDTSGAMGFLFLIFFIFYVGTGFLLGMVAGAILAVLFNLRRVKNKSRSDYVKIVAGPLLIPVMILGGLIAPSLPSLIDEISLPTFTSSSDRDQLRQLNGAGPAVPTNPPPAPSREGQTASGTSLKWQSYSSELATESFELNLFGFEPYSVVAVNLVFEGAGFAQDGPIATVQIDQNGQATQDFMFHIDEADTSVIEGNQVVYFLQVQDPRGATSEWITKQAIFVLTQTEKIYLGDEEIRIPR